MRNLFAGLRLGRVNGESSQPQQVDGKQRTIALVRSTYRFIVTLLLLFVFQSPFATASSHAADPRFVDLNNGAMYDTVSANYAERNQAKPQKDTSKISSIVLSTLVLPTTKP